MEDDLYYKLLVYSSPRSEGEREGGSSMSPGHTNVFNDMYTTLKHTG